MSERVKNLIEEPGLLDEEIIQSEKRRALRKSDCSEFKLDIDSASIGGFGSDISRTGAYIVTCDEISIAITIKASNREQKVSGRIVRIDSISKGSHGVAIQFDTPLKDE